jgi:CubicO group peptidase (beta-lactamase class C family)
MLDAVVRLAQAIVLTSTLLFAGLDVARAEEAPADEIEGIAAGLDLEPFVDGLVESAMRADRIAGVGIAIVRHGEVLVLKGYGQARDDGTPVNPETTLFRIASISKTFTWIGLMQLVESGRVDLEKPVNAYLPTSIRIPDDGFEEPILVRHLLTHSAGFEDLVAGHLFVADADRALPLTDALRRYRPKRVRRPGAGAVYSNYGVALAGALVQHVAGESFEAYIERSVLTPLGLQDTTFREPYSGALAQSRGLPSPMSPALAPDVSQGFRWIGGRHAAQPFEHVVQFAPAGAVSATPADMARYLNALSAGLPQVLQPQTAAAFSSPDPLFANAPGVNGLAHGFLQYRTPGGWRGFGHGGNTLWFHSNLVVYPDLGLGVFVTTNSERGVTLSEILPVAVADRLGGAPAIPRDHVEPALPLRKFAGAYMSERRSYSNAERAFCLVQCVFEVTASDGGLVVSTVSGSYRFVPDGVETVARDARIHRFRNVTTGGIAAFEEQGGQIVRVHSSSGVLRADRISAFAGPQGFAVVVGFGAIAALMAFLSGLSRVFSRTQPTPAARLAGIVLPAAGAAYLFALIAFASYFAAAGENAWTVFADWPGAMRPGAWGAAVGAGLTAFAALSAGIAWFSSDWSAWRRARILATLIALGGLGFMLNAWNLVGPRF